MLESDQLLDARGLNCPLPILRAKQCLNNMQVGQILRILATDSGAMEDFRAFAGQTGHVLLEAIEAEGEYRFLLQKS